MKRDGVSLALDLVLEEIAAVEAQLNHEGMAAFKNSRYQDAERLGEAGKQLQAFSKRLASLQGEWTSGIDIKTRERVKVDPSFHTRPHKKGPRQNLRITLSNGRVIQRSTAAAAMVDVIEALGVEQVMDLGLDVYSGVPLVGTTKVKKYTQASLGQFLVCTHSSTTDKKKMLDRMGLELRQPLKVDVIPS